MVSSSRFPFLSVAVVLAIIATAQAAQPQTCPEIADAIQVAIGVKAKGRGGNPPALPDDAKTATKAGAEFESMRNAAKDRPKFDPVRDVFANPSVAKYLDFLTTNPGTVDAKNPFAKEAQPILASYAVEKVGKAASPKLVADTKKATAAGLYEALKIFRQADAASEKVSGAWRIR